MHYLKVASLVSGLVLACVLPPTEAAVNWKGEPFSLRTRGMPLVTLFRDFGANYQLPVVVSEAVNDVFTGSIDDEKPESVIKRLARLYHLAWYYNGDTLFIYKAREVTSEVITPQFASSSDLFRYLSSRKVTGVEGCRLQEVKGFQSFEISGVPACIHRVTALTKDLEDKARTRAVTHESIRVFPLRYASAADITYQYRQQEVVVPGVVSILNQMKSGNVLPTADNNDSAGIAVGATQFSADPSQNAVLVKSREANMDVYRSLIEQLDKQNHQIEITVAIIDVDEANLKQLGVDWNGSLKGSGVSASFNSGISDGSYMSGVVSNAGQFMAQISALQQRSQAQILSQPSVVTLNNVQAILDKNITFYTRVRSENVAKLESVTSGTLMRVTPRVVESVSGSRAIEEIMLQLNIQDGQQLAATGSEDALPQVQNSEITTQATLKPGESLLLGGFVQDKQMKGRRSIPLLGDLPFIGHLFGTERNEKQSVVRLFLIKAVPVSLDTQGKKTQ
ncbi:EscC/YscC/HrcC family type III secretion system outer membrane ring protein [Ewingella americana]|uniref:EscC/YscC/HrcC family type III secretion system outer membrane ring protein n=1 Tax=Ewingella americana TaxID=41202 RepID=UPI0012AD50E7|nr:EscC/YscC/HrcC family type III secretion system outer membrane ring protein [Ewingella americana]MRT05899.1 EscC/YscC/HrcC family type III secretion system outer membrane ring protein [Ewingella americana]